MGVIVMERKYVCKNGVVEKTRFPYIAKKKCLSEMQIKIDAVKKQTENDKQAAKRLARILNSNFAAGDYFVTLTYTDEAIDALGEDVYDGAKKLIQLFLRRLRRKNKDIKYVYTTSILCGATGESVRIHHHLVISNCSAEEIEKEWQRYGSSHIDHLREQDDFTPIAVYLIKQGRNEPNSQAYSTSRNMDKPEITLIEVDDLDEIKVDPRDSILERNSYNPALSLCQYVRYKHYPKFQAPPGKTNHEGGDENGGN